MKSATQRVTTTRGACADDARSAESTRTLRERPPIEEHGPAVADLYRRLDDAVSQVTRRLQETLQASSGLTPEQQTLREALATTLTKRLAALRAAEHRLAFGHLELRDGDDLYIGRIGLQPEQPGGVTLVDWRAPAAAPFYQATHAEPGDVVRRRHLHLKGRQLIAVDDELLACPSSSEPIAALADSASSHSALSRALLAPRTGRMADIVATLQAEQDRIIRTPGKGPLLVHGAPGTGKTVVALHRAAYLLYSEPSRRQGGVLVVGPTPVFLDYISQVLPSLGESEVVLGSVVSLYRGEASINPAPETESGATLKADLRMSAVLRNAVRHRQRRLLTPLELDLGSTTVTLHPDTVQRARGAARSTGEPHNQARDIFVERILEDLERQYCAASNRDAPGDPRDAATLRSARRALHESLEVRREVNKLWLPLTPEQVLRSLFSRPDELTRATPGWSEEERSSLHRPADAPWTVADVALLDELAELLGPLPRHREHAVTSSTLSEATRHAEETLAAVGLTEAMSAEDLARRYGLIDADHDTRPLAERAADDSCWAFGHVVVDEAQDLAPMQWRMILRRCPSRSMTIVGDLHQRQFPFTSVGDWRDVLAPHLRTWREESLTVNYRIPAEHLEFATDDARARGWPTGESTSVRDGGEIARVHADVTDDKALLTLARGEAATVTGTVALISVHAERLNGHDPNEPRITVTSPSTVRGLEFDTVLVVDPDRIAAEHGAGALYLCLTRATHRLVIIRPHHSTSRWPADRGLSLQGTAGSPTRSQALPSAHDPD